MMSINYSLTVDSKKLYIFYRNYKKSLFLYLSLW